jgi:hypothetical protein
MQNKTIAELRADMAALINAAKMPGIPADERMIYVTTIQQIEALIERMTADERIPSHPTPPPPPPRKTPTTVSSATPPPPAARPRRTIEDADCIPIVEASLEGGTKRVKIEWGHGKADLLTEGEARSRFTSCLRDLAESRMAKVGRMADLRQYMSFSRARGYYAALTEFWGAPPTALQLAIAPLGRTKSEIFDMIRA